MHDQLVDGRDLKMQCVNDEYTRECLAIEVGASLRLQDVILTLSRLMRLYGKPVFLVGQWRRIYRCQGHALAARRCSGSGLYCAWQSMAKRIRRKFQRQTARRIAKPRMVPQPRRGQDAHRTLAAVLERAPAPQRSSLPTSGHGPSSLAGFR